MKTISKFIILFLAIAFVSCQDDDKVESKIIVNKGQIQSPKWLIHVIDSAAHTYNPSPVTGEYPYPWVYSVSYHNQEYILVEDMLESCYTCGNLLFNSSGDPIKASEDIGSGLYWDLLEKGNRTLIWQHESFK